MTELINPYLFKVAVHKVRPMYRSKFYLAGMQQGGRIRLLRSNTRHKTYGAAVDYADKVMKRWVKLYDAAVVAMSAQEPTPA